MHKGLKQPKTGAAVGLSTCQWCWHCTQPKHHQNTPPQQTHTPHTIETKSTGTQEDTTQHVPWHDCKIRRVRAAHWHIALYIY